MTTLPSAGELPEELVAEARELRRKFWRTSRVREEVDLLARALMAERERAAREERESIVARLTEAEARCCHMLQCLSDDDLPQWRKEFSEIDRSEHCSDCPVFTTPSRAALQKDQNPNG